MKQKLNIQNKMPTEECERPKLLHVHHFQTISLFASDV